MATPMGGPPSPASPSLHGDPGQAPSRSNSVASTNSNASVVSLTRKPRTRARARTLTGGRPENIRIPTNASDAVGGSIQDRGLTTNSAPVEVLAGDLNVATPTQAGFDISPPPRPPRSVQRRSMTAVHGMESLSLAPLEGRLPFARYTSESQPAELNRISRVWSTGEITRTARDSWIAPDSASTQASFHFPPERPRVHVRDSMLTHKSTTTSSSVFPPSTSTASGPQSPASPRSLLPYEDDHLGPPENPEFDGDEVSYRLQLLVKNSYFLPPAHSKPSPSDLATSSPKTRKPTPTFLDIFRVGKTRSKPPTPDSSTECLAPVLRTTSDSTTASGHVQRQPPTPVRSLPPVSPQNTVARVVVVREKMEDLVTAAKQAELDLKARREREQGSQRARQGSQRDLRDELNVIDPTESVDLPPVSAEYPFAMQTSALHGLTVQDSIGAADLAEHLPPPRSPGMSTLDTEEAAWRKALLHEAVNLSLHTTDSSFSASSHRPSDSNAAATSPVLTAPEPSRSLSMKRILGQKILQQMSLEEEDLGHVEGLSQKLSPSSNRAPSPTAGLGAGLSSREGRYPATRQSTYLPVRAETPSNLYPLAPPPRKMSNPTLSFSQMDLHSPHRSDKSWQLRKSISSPLLSDSYDSEVRAGIVMTPPPVPHVNVTQPQSFTLESGVSSSSVESHRWVESVVSSSSCYSEEEAEAEAAQPRPSMTLSVDRPSLSEYSQPSPRGSAFRDAFHEHYTQTRSSHDGPPSSRTSAASPPPRFSTMSPPPRVSSSFAQIALSPPPRSSSLNYPAKYRVRVSSPRSGSPIPTASDPGHDWRGDDSAALNTIHLPEPTTPPSIAERRRTAVPPPTLHIPARPIPASIHSAPPPSSPTSFFDQIESNAVDDIDSSDDSDVGDDYQTASQEAPSLPPLDTMLPPLPADLAHPETTFNPDQSSGKRPFMRLGNHSTPHVSRSGFASPVAYSFDDRQSTFTSAPRRLPYFSRKKAPASDLGHGPLSSSDFYKYVQQQPALLEPARERRSVSTENNVVALRHKQKDLESLRKLDGMLIQHMEREKDTLKRIASSTVSKT